MRYDGRLLAGLMAGLLLAAVPAVALPRSIGVAEPPIVRQTGNAADVPMTGIIGKTFVFLEKRRSEQTGGYPAFSLAAATSDLLTNKTGTLPYQTFVGKAIRATSVVPHPERHGEYTVTFIEPELGHCLVANTFGQAIRDVAPADDLRLAKERWIDRTLYAKTRWMATYDAQRDWFGQVALQMAEPLKVVDVVWGFDSAKPLWIVVERRSGERGFMATAYSWTNHYADGWALGRPWEDKLAEINPKEEFFANNEGSDRRLMRALRNSDPGRMAR